MNTKFRLVKKDNACIILCVIFLLIQLVLFLYNFSWNLSPKVDDWAAFSTFFGLSFSFASALLIYLTYRSQTNMSSVLQFESIFFQWHQQHRELYRSLKSQITEFSNDVVVPCISNHQGAFNIAVFQNYADDESKREVVRYYRDLYQILKYIHLNDILGNDERQKKKYVDIVQAQMTDEELNTVLFLLLADKLLHQKRVFVSCSWLEFVDNHHLFKNFYYPKNNSNFIEFTSFMHETFPKTKNSFHFLRKEES